VFVATAIEQNKNAVVAENGQVLVERTTEHELGRDTSDTDTHC
jgi:hypothetical protein